LTNAWRGKSERAGKQALRRRSRAGKPDVGDWRKTPGKGIEESGWCASPVLSSPAHLAAVMHIGCMYCGYGILIWLCDRMMNSRKGCRAGIGSGKCKISHQNLVTLLSRTGFILTAVGSDMLVFSDT
jgi:hypothetical protein